MLEQLASSHKIDEVVHSYGKNLEGGVARFNK